MKKRNKTVALLLVTGQLVTYAPIAVQASEGVTDAVAQAVDSSEESVPAETPDSAIAPSSESSTVSSSSDSSSSVSSETKPSGSTAPSSSQEPPKKEEPDKEAPQTHVVPAPSSTEPQPAETPPLAQAPQEQPAPPASGSQGAAVSQDQTVPSSTVTQDGALHFEKDESVDSFIRKIGDSARKVGKQEDLYASVMIAQAILESASGQSTLAQPPNHNLFGIKGTYQGASVSMATQEDNGAGNLYTIQAAFRVYENYDQCFADYAELIKKGISGAPNYYAGVWKSQAKTYQEATKFLTGRYATDTQYNQKLNGLIETYDLTQYDKEIQGAAISHSRYQVPLDHYTISSSYGNRGAEFHRGLDLAANQGEPIHASKSGTVLKAESHASWGNYVVLQHDDGQATLYAHQQYYAVKAGDAIQQGQTIGYVGNTGNSTGPHLHLELCRDGSMSQELLLDPQEVLFREG
ncbi:N-acetylmuramoyl-L-alanine amidase (plasmid) [Enterococcus gilvus]|jgi:flagellum-specific peptidoglycan hydrolase FlgJ|uniref:glucosaminidase domain-containing protein n=1 Tax=Enterococcus gilvus TaxID=160453 RepID=UPI000DF60417|nr:glucosaminidase domain-containing protein [Enterococcus gilvus]AXG40506.1 N-acetylmuramoyl-L-alanine amidase [Enterococcus gilvus]